MRRLRRHEGKLDAWLLAGDTRAANALLLWADTGEAPRHASQVIMGRSTAATRARMVCTCAGVSDAQLKRSEEHTSELQSLMRSSYAVFCLKTKKKTNNINKYTIQMT